MTATTPTHVDSSIPEIWAKNVLRTHLEAGFWGRFVGQEGSGAPIIQKTELLNKPGDLIHIQVTDPLSGAGVSGDTATLEGNEENLTTSEIKASPVLYRHGVRINRRANKKSILDLRAEAAMRLGEWGMAKMDAKRFELFLATALPAPLASETYNAANTYGVNHPTGDVDDIVAADTLTVEALQQIGLTLRVNLAKPLMVDGFEHYALVTNPYATYQLKRETEYQSWVREAAVRGESNPFFRGALAVVDGMIIFEHQRIARVTNANAVPAKVATSIAFGGEAFIEAVDENVHSEEDTFDYGLEWGKSYEFAVQPRRALEENSLKVFVAAPDIA